MYQVRPYLLPIAVLVLFVVAYLPAFEDIIAKWSASDDYTHAFFTVPIAAYMIWQRRAMLIVPAGRPVIGPALVVLSMVLYIFALQLQVPTIIFLATVTTVVSVLVWFGGLRVLVAFGVPILLLFMVIPIPNQVLSMATGELQLWVSSAGETIIRLFSVPLFREGNILNIPDKSFQVVDACSGIRSLISLTTLSLIIGYFMLEKVWSTALLFACAVPAALLINIIRVVTLVLAYHFAGIDLSEGTPHTVIGLVLFGFGLFLLFICERILERWEARSTNN